MGDRELALLNIFKTHFPNGNCDDFTRKDNADFILFADAFGGSALGIWKIESQLTALEAIERALNKVTGEIEVLAPSVRKVLLSPVEISPQQVDSPFLQLIEIQQTLLHQITAAKRAAKEAAREPGQRTRERTTYPAVAVALWCRNIWAFETGAKAPHKINAARRNPPFGRFLQDVLDELNIGIKAASALDALARIERPPASKEKSSK